MRSFASFVWHISVLPWSFDGLVLLLTTSAVDKLHEDLLAEASLLAQASGHLDVRESDPRADLLAGQRSACLTKGPQDHLVVVAARGPTGSAVRAFRILGS
jgi:hypothetical protein